MKFFPTYYPGPMGTTATVSRCIIVNPGVYNVIFDACCDSDLYEEPGETRPSYDLVKNAARMLINTSIANAMIAPYFGEINVTWKTDGRRVKAIFGPAPDALSVYCEQMTDGRVTQKELKQNAGTADLKNSIEWLSNPSSPCVMQAPTA
jgi:hypothetical protein